MQNPVTTNFLHQTRNLVYFDNIPMYNLCISQQMQEIECAYSGFHDTPRYVTSPYMDEVNLSFDVYVNSYDRQMRMFDSFYHRHGYGCDSLFGILGKGWVCKFCGDYSPSGSINCIKCGGQAREDFVKPMQFPFMISDISTDSLLFPRDELHTMTINMVGFGRECTDVIFSLLDGQNIFFANGYSLESGYYLCAYCGQAVPENETCPGCGGKRLTFRELVKLNRKCVYCGRQVFGGIVCQRCGARIKGLTFKKVFGKVV